MFRPYYVVNLCLHELRNCSLPGPLKQQIERSLIEIKNLILDEDDRLSDGHEFARLYHHIRYVCGYDSSQSELDKLFSLLQEVIARLKEKL